MANVFKKLINEYHERSNGTRHAGSRLPEALGEFFYDSDTGKLYLSGADDEGELKWFTI